MTIHCQGTLTVGAWQVPYNFERILFLLTGGDSEAVKALMEEMEVERRMTLSEDVRRGLRQTFQTLVVDDQAMAEEIRLRWRHGYLIDPHTAVGLRAARVHREDAAIVVSIATAHACKFEEALRVALGDAWWEGAYPARTKEIWRACQWAQTAHAPLQPRQLEPQCVRVC